MSASAVPSRKRTSPSRLSESSSDDEGQRLEKLKIQKTSYTDDVKTGRDTSYSSHPPQQRPPQSHHYQQHDNSRGHRPQYDHHRSDRGRGRYDRNDHHNDRGHYQHHRGQGDGRSSQHYDNRSHHYDNRSSYSRDRRPSDNFYNSDNSSDQGRSQYNNYQDRDAPTNSGRDSRMSTQSGFSNYSAEGEGLAPVVARHYNEIKEKGLEAREESKIVILRKYNNWAKSMNFNDAMEELRRAGKRNNTLVGLDLCCGKGGDLRKWEKSQMMSHVVFVDIAEVSLNNCRERYEDMKKRHSELYEKKQGRIAPLFTAEFIVADCTRESVKSKMRDPNMQFDMVSCQFSFHYCFESPLQAQVMLKNATENLVVGGYFIGTLPNADRIVKRRRERQQKEFGNEVYKIRFECEEPYPVYGARYFFELEDAISCPEFLVHFPSLERIAKNFGLELVYRHAFDKFHKIHVENFEAKRLLSGMGALETFPPNAGESLHFDDKNYEHARRYLDHKQGWEMEPPEIKVGTISSVEWEAITLYLAFCFKKSDEKTAEG